jgi:hypothetical protein
MHRLTDRLRSGLRRCGHRQGEAEDLRLVGRRLQGQAIMERDHQVRDEFASANPSYRHVAGGTKAVTGDRLPEEYIRGQGRGTRGSLKPDLTFEGPNCDRIRINTVDTNRFGEMTPREQRAFDRIFEVTGEPTIALPKV